MLFSDRELFGGPVRWIDEVVWWLAYSGAGNVLLLMITHSALLASLSRVLLLLGSQQ